MGKTMKDMLYDKQPLLVNPDLATQLGLEEAIFVQQLHFWLNTKMELQDKGEKQKTFKDGVMWNFNTIAEWLDQFPFFSSRKLQRIIAPLEYVGILVVTDTYNWNTNNRKKWYTVNYPLLERITKEEYQAIKKEFDAYQKNTSLTKKEKTIRSLERKRAIYTEFIEKANPLRQNGEVDNHVVRQNGEVSKNTVRQNDEVLHSPLRQSDVLEFDNLACSNNKDYNTKITFSDKQSDTVSDTRATRTDSSPQPVENVSKTTQTDVDAFEDELLQLSSKAKHNPFFTEETLHAFDLWERMNGEVGLAQTLKDLVFQTKRTAERKADEKRYPAEAIKQGYAQPIKVMLTPKNGLSSDLEQCVKRIMAEIHTANQKEQPIRKPMGYWNKALMNFWDVAITVWVDYNCDFLPEGAEYANRTTSGWEMCDYLSEETIHAQPMREQVRYFFVQWRQKNDAYDESARDWEEARNYVREHVSQFDGFTETGFQIALQDSRWKETLGANT